MKSNSKIFYENLVIGRNSVLEAIDSDNNIENIFISNNLNSKPIKNIINKAKIKGIPIKNTDSKRLDVISNNGNHQGVIAVMSEKKYSTVDEILELSKTKNELPFIVICDGIQDPHNFGAIIRTCECVGVHGIIIPKHRSVGVTSTVSKTSVGALEHILIAKVTNISSTIDYLKSKGIWIFGSDMSGTQWNKCDFKIPLALVLGSEGKGISKKTKEKCDFKITIPMFGKINSLNVSVASGILLYEIKRQFLN